MLVIKHLAREFDIDPYDIRLALRASGLKKPKGEHWKWPDENDKNYKKARAIVQKLKEKKLGKNS